jgi:uncharacterized protein with HEPN domain
VTRAIGIIGEAASSVSNELRDQTPQVPWSAIVGMRNILIRAYFDVDLDEVWRTVTTDLPPLIAVLEAALNPWVVANFDGVFLPFPCSQPFPPSTCLLQ